MPKSLRERMVVILVFPLVVVNGLLTLMIQMSWYVLEQLVSCLSRDRYWHESILETLERRKRSSLMTSDGPVSVVDSTEQVI